MEIRGGVGKKTHKKEKDNPSFLWRRMADFLDTLFPYINLYFIYNTFLRLFIGSEGAL